MALELSVKAILNAVYDAILGALRIQGVAGGNAVSVIGDNVVVSVTPVLDTNAYHANDLLFDSTEIPGAVAVSGGTCILQSVTVVDKDDQKGNTYLIFANAATDFGTPNAAPNPDDTGAATVIGQVRVTTGDFLDLGGASVATIRSLGLVLQASGGTSIWVAAITSSTPTHTASGMVIKLGLQRI